MKFADLAAGRTFRAGPREVTEREIVEFASKYDPQPFHVDPAVAERGRWGGLIASGWMTCAIAMELVARSILAGSESIGSPGVEAVEWLKPVRPGDRLSLEVTVLESRLSSSGTTGIVRWRWELHNQRGEVAFRLIGTSFFAVGDRKAPGPSAPPGERKRG